MLYDFDKTYMRWVNPNCITDCPYVILLRAEQWEQEEYQRDKDDYDDYKQNPENSLGHCCSSFHY